MRPGAYLIQADARAIPLANESVQCVVTSPPYWGLRDYGLPPSVWGGEPDHAHEWGAESVKTSCPCGSWRGVLGLEPTPELYVAHMVEVFREVRRVLRDDGTVWLNLGDSYASTPPGNKTKGVSDRSTLHGVNSDVYRETLSQSVQTKRNTVAPGLKPKDLVGIPWRVALALQADGWWLRSDVIWAKPNPMPESITDRPTKAHEYLFLLAKRERYYYDAEAVREPFADKRMGNPGVYRAGLATLQTPQGVHGNGVTGKGWTRGAEVGGRNRRTVWTIATQPYPEAHFATFPEKLVEPCILAGTSERGACPACGAPWWRAGSLHRQKGGVYSTAETIGWSPSCACPPAEPVPCRVLDPFAGSGTTVAVAVRLGRVGLGVELKPDYLRLAKRRTEAHGLNLKRKERTNG